MNPIARKLLCTLLILIAFVFLLGSALKSAVAQTPSKPTDKCQVCHNGANAHTVIMPCSQVNKYLQDHPGDYAGPCINNSHEKPPKPTPTP